MASRIITDQGLKPSLSSIMKIIRFSGRTITRPQLHAPPVPVLSTSDLGELRKVFDKNNFSAEPSTTDDSGTTILKMLFARGLSVGNEKAERIFQPLSLEVLTQSGLLRQDGGRVRSLFQAQPYQELIFFSDFFQWEEADDFVLPIGPAGHYLAKLTIRHKARSALDLGCGCGIQALLASVHSEEVTATDVNARAVALTRLNAALNGINNIVAMEGSYFEPIENRSFDQIVANLPYVITPENQHVYRDVDQPGDLSLRKWLKEIPGHLTEGGFAQVLVNWVHQKDEPWWQPLRQTLADAHSDTWLIYTASKQPGEYADIWIDRNIYDDPAKFKKARHAWLNWYKSNHISQIALGAVVLRRRASTNNWFQAAQAKRNLEDSASDQILRMFDMQDIIISKKNQSLLLDDIFIAKDIDFPPAEKGEKPLVSQLNGLRLETEIHPVTLAVLQQLDGKTSIRTAIQSLSFQPEFASIDIQSQILADIIILIQYGILVFPTVQLHPGGNSSSA